MSPDPHPCRSLVLKTWWETRNGWRLLGAQSAFKVGFVFLFALAFEAGLVALFLDGFRFLKSLGGVGTLVLSRLFSLFFLGMGVMLVASGIVTGHASFFGSDEVAFLLARPFRMTQIAVYRMLEAAALSSWAFGFVVVPFMLAYAIHERLSPLFALWTLVFSVPWVLLWAAIGSLIALILRRWGPRGRWARLGALAAVAGVVVWGWLRWRMLAGEPVELRFDLWRLVPGLRLASNRLLPSWWMAEGLQAFEAREWARGLRLWGVLAAHALMAVVAVEWVGEAVLFDAWQRVAAERIRNPTASRSFRWLDALLAPLPPDMRALLAKDVRTFCRDTSQWSQAVIFFGLLALYFSNLRSLRYHILPPEWRNAIAFLNVFSVSSVVCSLGSRFVYPQISLEGHGCWMLGLAPTNMRRVLVAKFSLSAVGLCGVSVALMTLSTRMLGATPAIRWLSLALTTLIALAVCALSTGLGAVFLDLRHRNPAAIVSGFGGTLNLVLSLGLMLAVIVPFAWLFHGHFLRGTPWQALATRLAVAGAWAAALGAMAVILPLWAGARSLEQREF